MTAKTSEYLATVLDGVGLVEMAAKARRDEYHDFLSEADLPELMLERELRDARDGCPDKERAARIEAIRRRHLQGEFDASNEESEAWAQSAEGRAAFAGLLGKK